MEFGDLMRYAYRLRFPAQLERLFQADYERKSITITRIGLVLGIALVVLFGFLDIWAAPLALSTIWVIRYLVICPVFGAMLLLTFAPFFARLMQPLIAIAVVTAGLGIAAMSGVTSPQEPAYASYYVGLLLVIMWGYTFIRLRFWYATCAGLIIVGGYEVVAIGYQQLLASAMGRLAFATSNFFFVAANILGMFAGYFIELYARRDFLQRRLLQDDALRAIAAGTAAKTGDDFLQSLVAQLASALHVRYAYLTERVDGLSGRLRVLANWEDGAFGPNEDYDLVGTPCADVIGGQVCFYPRQVQALFPEDADLAALGVQSYLGVPLVDGAGVVLGHLVVMDDQPLATEDRPRYETILQIFAARASAELVRQHADAKLHQVHEELERRVVERTAQLEAALAERTRLADILEATSDMVAFATLDGTILYFNRAGRRIAGVPDDADITQFGFVDFYPPAALELLGTVGIPTALREGTWSGETVIQPLHGGEVPVSLVGIVHRAPDGSPTHLSAIIRDISERKRAEEALQRAKEAAEEATRAKSTFLANMSHEIRTPMNGIIGMTDLLLETDLGLAQRDFVETIRTSGDALLTIINDILDFSKIEAGKLDLEHRPFDLRGCVEAALDVLAHRAAEKGLDLAAQFDANTPAAVVGDEVRLRQILVNLLGNAIKFTERGEVVVSVRSQESGVKSRESANDNLPSAIGNLQFSVKDTGIGIPPDRIDQLFQSFSQVDPSTTRKYGGTGLGLVISQRLAELMGGRMWVESVPGQGSTFFFTLQAPVAPDALPIYLRGDQPELCGKHLLVVDDTPTNRMIVCHQVASWGMTCDQAASGAEALALFQAGQSFDLAILDMDMPDMDGLELAQRIRRSQGPGELPLVMLTSLGQRPPGQLVSMFAAFLTKPVKASQLYNTLVAVFMQQDLNGPAEDKRPPAAFDTQLGARLPLHLLLAEDNPINQKVALLALERLGYTADVAANGHEAISAVERQPYDLVLMDVHMPVLDGLQATRHIRASQNIAGGRQPRIIAMTANAMQGDHELCLAAGMDDYIAKPVHIHQLLVAIERAGSNSTGERKRDEVLDSKAVHSLSLALHPSIEPAVDWAALAEFGRAGATDQLIALFLADAPLVLAAIQGAVAQGDAIRLREAAHSLKGSSTYMGARILAARLAELEQIGLGGSVNGAAAVLAYVEREFARVRQVLMEEQPA